MSLDTKDKNQQAFFALLRAGLFPVHGSRFAVNGFDCVDWDEVYRMTEEQSLIGLVSAGLDWFKVNDSSQIEAAKPSARFTVPEMVALQFIGQTLQIEQRNRAMNVFISSLIDKMRAAGIYTLLVKGQGVAQCYEKPLWRACGDVDLFLSEENYAKAKEMLVPLASSVEKEYEREKHLGMTINGWVVELHGRLYCGLSSRIERELDDVLQDTFYCGNVRSWNNNGVQVFQLGVENDVFYVFTHILQHFYKEGVGLRQICDWCRLLYTYKDSLNYGLLEQRIKRAGLMSEWKLFGALAIEYLGFPKDSMPLLDVRSKKEDVRWRKKADRIMEFILKSGNMGHNRDMSHFSKYPYLIRKCVSMGRRIGDLINHVRIFPLDSLWFFPRIMFNGVRSAIKGE